jgi:two-component system, OmpR family, sensor histidine kinase KdpD
MHRVVTPHPFSHYLFALIIVIVFSAGLYALRESLTDPLIALLYLLPVVISTTYGGLGPGVVSALSAFLGFNFLFIQPYYSLRVHHTQDLLALMVFLIVATVTSELVGRAQSSMAAANAREREAIWLYELSTALAGSIEDQTIVRVLAEQCQRTFKTTSVQINLEHTNTREALVFTIPEGFPSPESKPLRIVPLETARGLLGEICIWREASPKSILGMGVPGMGAPGIDAPGMGSSRMNGSGMSNAEERLLRTYASQGALALERARLAQTVTHARVLEESDRLKSALLSSVSHELRTPLATIKAAVTSLRSGEANLDAASQQDLLAAIEEETDHLNQLVGNLLNMSRLEAGALHPQPSWNVLSEIVYSVLRHMQQDVKKHRLEVNVSEDLPLVPVDFTLMEQVFTNLISNSAKYSPEGSLIRIQARLGDNQNLLVQVSNQGPPVLEANLERIFDKFYRVTAADKVTGTGLGLSICKGIIEAHGGRIWARNLEKGFAFLFTLPLSREGLIPQTPVEVEET